MTPGEQYRRLAAEFRARAKHAPAAHLTAQWDHLAQCYLRLAEQADQNSQTDICIEVGPKPALDGDQT